MYLIVFLFFTLVQLEASKICKIEGCNCENDSGYDYITCFFDQSIRLQKNTNNLSKNDSLVKFYSQEEQSDDIKLIDTFTLKIGDAGTVENIFAGLSINILFMDGSNLKSVNPDIFNNIVSIKNIYLSNNLITFINFTLFDANFKNSIQSIILKNNLFNQIPSLAELENLNYLDMSSNRISYLKELEKCESPLETIDFSNNNITHLNYNFSAKLKQSLTSLILNSNKISQLGNLNGFEKLNNLQISRNQLFDLTQRAFINLPKLKHLDLSHNAIKTIHNDTFSSLMELYLLDLSHNQIELLIIDYFKSLKNLQKLFIQSNKIKNLDFTVFNNQNLLYVLDLSDNEIERVQFENSSNFTNLQLMRLSENKLKSIDYEALFSKMSNIRMLYLENNYLDQVPKYLGSLIKLDLSNQNGRLVKIPDSAFYRYDTSVLLRLNLSKNHSLKFSNRSFCVNQERSDSKYFMDLVMSSDTLASINKCVLKQLSKTHRRVRIFTENSIEQKRKFCDCEFRLFLAHYSILVKDVCPRFKTYCKDVKFKDDCDTSLDFVCPSSH